MKDKLGLDLRTKISTIVAIGAYLNMLLATFDPSIIADNEQAMTVYRIVSAFLALCAWINSHYYNQNYTPEGMTGTLTTRHMKDMRGETVTYVEEPEDSFTEMEEAVAEDKEESEVAE